jgi:GH35 family endo-1,4-beta-xylanase
MKSICTILVTVLAAACLVSCKEEVEEQPYLEVAQEELQLFFETWEAATRELSVSTNVTFTANSDAPWCVATVREAEDDNLLIAVESNEGTEVRKAHVTLTGKGVPPVVIEVEQATDAPYMTINDYLQWQLLLSANAYSATRIVRSNRPVTATSDQAWCSVTMMDYKAGKTTQEFWLEVEENESIFSERTAIITISYLGLESVQMKITQPASLIGAAATWQEAAAARIELYRKNDVRIRVMQGGQPVQGASVSIDMQEHEFLFGCSFANYNWDSHDETFLRQFADLFNYATIEFYWGEYEPVRGQPNHARAWEKVNWCNANGITHLKGHPLVYSWNPDWVYELSEVELNKCILDRIYDCTSEFSGYIDYWDVVNEGMRGLMFQYGGVDNFTKNALVKAHEGNPQSIRLLNEYDVSQTYVNFLRRMMDDAGQPFYDVIGMQSHQQVGAWGPALAWEVCERFRPFGKPLHFTETTILSSRKECGGDYCPTNPADEEVQKNQVIDFYTIMFSHPSVEAVTWWNLSDLGAWQEPATAGMLRRDMTPKPAYTALKKLVKEEWATHETQETNVAGEVQLRAFRGKYRFTVTLPGGQTQIFDGVVGKEENVVELRM